MGGENDPGEKRLLRESIGHFNIQKNSCTFNSRRKKFLVPFIEYFYFRFFFLSFVFLPKNLENLTVAKNHHGDRCENCCVTQHSWNSLEANNKLLEITLNVSEKLVRSFEYAGLFISKRVHVVHRHGINANLFYFFLAVFDHRLSLS